MSATTLPITASNTRAHQASLGGWPACEQADVAGDGSMRWAGAVALAGSSVVAMGLMGWLGQALLRVL